MTEELREALASPLWSCHERILTSSNIDKILNEQMSIIAERCGLKDKSPIDLEAVMAANPMFSSTIAGWRPVKEIKKEAKG